jgi:hypothetical protein
MPAMLSAFGDGMRERGYVEGQNLSIDVRWPQGTFEHNPSPRFRRSPNGFSPLKAPDLKGRIEVNPIGPRSL